MVPICAHRYSQRRCNNEVELLLRGVAQAIARSTSAENAEQLPFTSRSCW
jgi:hypothetical protein